MKQISAVKLFAFGFCLLFGSPISVFADSQFAPVLEGKELRFPKDHGSHPDFATEWWYFTGHLKGESTFGFELVFFRVGVEPNSSSRSAWKLESIYLALGVEARVDLSRPLCAHR